MASFYSFANLFRDLQSLLAWLSRDRKFSDLFLLLICYDITCHVTSRKFHCILVREWELKRANDNLVLLWKQFCHWGLPENVSRTLEDPQTTLWESPMDMNSLWKLESPYEAVMITLKIYALGIKKRSLLPGYYLPLEEYYACITLLQTGPQAQTEKQFLAQISFSFLRIKKKTWMRTCCKNVGVNANRLF